MGQAASSDFLPSGESSPNSLFCSAADLAEKTSSLSFPATLATPTPLALHAATALRRSRSILHGPLISLR